MLRSFVYIVVGWLFIAVVGGLADVFSITVMLPATSAVIISHVAFSRESSVPVSLFVAVALGYLEDLHQGAPLGTLTLAYALSYLALRWASARIALTGWARRGLVALVAVVLVDLATFGVLIAMADVFEIGRDVLVELLFGIHWHALATMLVAPPAWALLDRTMTVLHLDDRPPGSAYWTGK